MTNKEKFNLKANIIIRKLGQILGVFGIGLSVGWLAFTFIWEAVILIVFGAIAVVICSVSLPKAQADYDEYLDAIKYAESFTD